MLTESDYGIQQKPPESNKPRAIIQSRMGSERLPGKALLNIAGCPLTEHVVRRVHSVVPEPVLAVPDSPENDPLVNAASSWPCKIYRGPEQDVLARFAGALSRFPEADPILRVTGDNPLISPALIESLLELQKKHEADLLAFTRTPLGTNCSLIRRNSLLAAEQEARSDFDREHVSTWIKSNPQFKKKYFLPPAPFRAPGYRLTVDVEKDLELVRELYSQLDRDDPLLPVKKVISHLDDNPNLAETNQNVKQVAYDPPDRIFHCYNTGGSWGSGHRQRFQLLANQVHEDFENPPDIFVGRGHGSESPDKDSLKISRHRPDRPISISSSNQPLEMSTIKKCCRRTSPDLAILDVKNTDLSTVQELQRKVSHVVGVEDRGDGRAEFDAIFDPNLYPGVLDNDRLPEKGRFYGPDYAIISPEFRRVDSGPTRSKLKQVGLCFGGTDPGGLGRRFSQNVASGFRDVEFKLYGPKASESPENVNSLGYVDNPIQDFASLDLLVISGGMIKFEIACLQQPAIIIAQNREQLINCRRFIEKNDVEWPCFGPDSSPEQWTRALDEAAGSDCRKRWAKSAGNVVDGFGLNRLVNYVKQKIE